MGKYKEIITLKRLFNIQRIHNAIKKKQDVQRFNVIDKTAYVLWQDADTRNSDILLSLRLYEIFYPDFVKNRKIEFKDFWNIPKMYDIQRNRADIQNTEGLFPAVDEVRIKRKKKESEFHSYYSEEKTKHYNTLPDYYLYLDESGKTDQYFILGGLLINGGLNNDSQEFRFNNLKKELNSKYHLNIKEFKFTDINSRNIKLYKDLIDISFAEGIPMTFVSIIVENKGLKRKTDKNKTNDLLELLLNDKLVSLIVRATCSSPYASSKAKVNVTIDKDSSGYDMVEKEKIRQKLNKQFQNQFEHFITIDKFNNIDSKENIFVQLSDLYVSSINNIFSQKNIDSVTAKCKKEFAEYLLQHVGLQNITTEISKPEAKIKFLNKYLTTN